MRTGHVVGFKAARLPSFTAREERPNGQIVGERLVAVRQESGKKEFAVIRGFRLNYLVIGSSSLAAAIQVEEEEAIRE